MLYIAHDRRYEWLSGVIVEIVVYVVHIVMPFEIWVYVEQILNDIIFEHLLALNPVALLSGTPGFVHGIIDHFEVSVLLDCFYGS